MFRYYQLWVSWQRNHHNCSSVSLSSLSQLVHILLKCFVDQEWKVLKMILFYIYCEHDEVTLPRLDQVYQLTHICYLNFFRRSWNLIKKTRVKVNQALGTEKSRYFPLYLKQFCDPITRGFNLMCKDWVIWMLNMCTIVKMIKVLHLLTKILKFCLII